MHHFCLYSKFIYLQPPILQSFNFTLTLLPLWLSSLLIKTAKHNNKERRKRRKKNMLNGLVLATPIITIVTLAHILYSLYFNFNNTIIIIKQGITTIDEEQLKNMGHTQLYLFYYSSYLLLCFILQYIYILL